MPPSRRGDLPIPYDRVRRAHGLGAHLLDRTELPRTPGRRRGSAGRRPVKALIAGCGYTGRRLAARLLADGVEVVGTVREPSGASRLEEAGIRPLIVDADDPGSTLTLEMVAPDVCFLPHPSRPSRGGSGRRSYLQDRRGASPGAARVLRLREQHRGVRRSRRRDGLREHSTAPGLGRGRGTPRRRAEGAGVGLAAGFQASRRENRRDLRARADPRASDP